VTHSDSQEGDPLARYSAPRPRSGNGALLALGFRPFFLLAAVTASLLLLLWILQLEGSLNVGGRYGAIGWHAHEMLFGYAVAVIAGFLLTAVRNWTRLPTASGRRLAVLVGLWLAGRLVMLGAGLLPAIAVVVVDFAFLPLLAVSLVPSLWRAQAWRNLTLIGLIGVLALANLEVHLAALDVAVSGAQLGQHLGLAAIVMMMVVVGGRVIPAFPRNALPKLEVRSWAWADWLAIILTLAYLIGVLLALGPPVVGMIALAAGVTIGIRMIPWRSFGTRAAPILWVLHLGYAWIAVGLVLSGAAILNPGIPASAGAHALGVGAIGTLTLGMMSRVALGHTGRALVVRSPIVWAYGLVTLAAAVRVTAAFFPAQFMLLIIAGLAWAIAFAIFAAIYWPILVHPRANGRPD
jgi:uncharacterized protein involved in response to NO